MKQSSNSDASTNNGDSGSCGFRERVYFRDVEILEFPLILGDNPHCQGAPLQLAWKATGREVIDIDFYEYTHKATHGRSKKHFHMADVEREIYLLSIGYDMNAIMDVCEQGKKIRKDRYNSFHAKKWDRFRVVMESAKEKLTLPSSKDQNVVSAMTA